MPADPVVALLPVTQADVAAANALDDALGFLTDLERPIVEQAFARHRIAHRTPTPASGDVREAVARAIATKTYAYCTVTSEGSDQYDCGDWEDFGCDAKATYLAAADEALSVISPTPDSSAVSGSADGLREALERAKRRLPHVTIDAMGGDNLAVTLCSHFDDGEGEEDENGWTQAASDGCDETLAAIHHVYAAALTEGEQS